jgi:hypothetical protein
LSITEIIAISIQENSFEPDAAGWQRVFAAIDARDAAGIASCRHRLIRTWCTSDSAACEGDVSRR